MYHQQWQADQQKQIISQMAGKVKMEKEKTVKYGVQIGFQKPVSILIEGNVDQKVQASKEKR
jgi:hypothetical protein